MKVIIVGNRSITDYEAVVSAIKRSGFKITEVVSGCAQGVDTLGLKYAAMNHIRVMKFPANWSKYGRLAGFVRNAQMADYGEALIAIYVGNSRGTLNMIKQAQDRKLPTYIVCLDNKPCPNTVCPNGCEDPCSLRGRLNG